MTMRLVTDDEAPAEAENPLRTLYAGILAGVDVFEEAATNERLAKCGMSERSVRALGAAQEALAELRAELVVDLLAAHQLDWTVE